MNNHLRERARITAIFLAAATLISLAFLVFAFIQKNEADEQRALAQQNRMEAEHQRFMAERVRMELVTTRLELEACKGK